MWGGEGGLKGAASCVTGVPGARVAHCEGVSERQAVFQTSRRGGGLGWVLGIRGARVADLKVAFG